VAVPLCVAVGYGLLRKDFGEGVHAGCVHFELQGETFYVGPPMYKAYDTASIKLQAHGDKSEPISFRNIWIRNVTELGPSHD
jgi:hypothetical protein